MSQYPSKNLQAAARRATHAGAVDKAVPIAGAAMQVPRKLLTDPKRDAFQLEASAQATFRATTRYVRVFAVPKSVGPGRVLCHNHVRHTVDMPCGLNGFRAWTCEAADKPSGFVKCPCGYAGLPHYAWREHVKASKGRARTHAEMVADGLMR
ncbi:hypothetical protein [Bradyrhizobium erythrophlei]|uniref:Uncharacterized protein n=1 Tax=Bradyrhizobium erythrophlei TaxID=1437360 RepID=A0A1M5H2X2_9BRAD|nr:hypothetical protein [Bradyrhizobium erythrophlei]SHG10243.1 hypothetical protein SAMN05443248_0290 [Bradyrhizobium erythrophlei]